MAAPERTTIATHTDASKLKPKNLSKRKKKKERKKTYTETYTHEQIRLSPLSSSWNFPCEEHRLGGMSQSC